MKIPARLQSAAAVRSRIRPRFRSAFPEQLLLFIYFCSFCAIFLLLRLPCIISKCNKFREAELQDKMGIALTPGDATLTLSTKRSLAHQRRLRQPLKPHSVVRNWRLIMNFSQTPCPSVAQRVEIWKNRRPIRIGKRLSPVDKNKTSEAETTHSLRVTLA